MFKKRINKIDTLHQIYDNHKIKQQLIDYIYSVVNLSNFKYKLMETHNDLQLLTTAKYYISGNYTGSNCLMVFTKNKDRFYSFLVDRKTLSYEKDRINIDNVDINPISLGLEDSIYDGTIIDGILSQTENSKIYIITDLYLFRGEDMTKDQIKYKLINIKKYLDIYINQDQNINSINVTVNNLYDIGEIKNLVTKVIPQTKQMQVRGIAFYPNISGTKLLYMFNKQSQPHNIPQHNTQQHNTQQYNTQISQPIPRMNYNQPYNQPYKQPYQQPYKQPYQQPYQRSNNVQVPVQQKRENVGMSNQIPKKHFEDNTPPRKTYFSGSSNNSPQDEIKENPEGQTMGVACKSKQKCHYVCKSNEQVILTFEMRQTEQCDVYNLYLVHKCKDGEKTILKTKRFGIAYIPTIQCSKMCKDIIIANNGKALMKCKFDDKREKWIPIEQDKQRKYPDYISTFDEKMDTIYDEDS